MATAAAAAEDKQQQQQAWLNSIQSALEVLHLQHNQRYGGGRNNHHNSNTNDGRRGNSSNSNAAAATSSQSTPSSAALWDTSLQHLQALETILLEQHNNNHNDNNNDNGVGIGSNNTSSNDGPLAPVTLDDPPIVFPPKRNPRRRATDNNNDDDSSSSSDEKGEAGDQVVLPPAIAGYRHSSTTTTTMAETTPLYTARRLLIRIHTGQAELHVGYGRFLQHQQQQQQQQQSSNGSNSNHSSSNRLDDSSQSNGGLNSMLSSKIETWTQVASLTSLAFEKGQAALVLADVAVSRWFQQREEGEQHPTAATGTATLFLLQEHIHAALTQDAEIVAVAISHLSQSQQRLETALSRERGRLESRLRPQWQSRDTVKQRWGEERWYNNPTPKHDYAAQREADERALTQVQQLLQQVQLLTTNELQQSAESLQNLLGRHAPTTSSATSSSRGGSSWTPSTTTQQQRNSSTHSSSGAQQRYNGTRPQDTSQRVSWQDYPDPASPEFGWTFTGSVEASRVEFFEKATTTIENGGSGDGNKIVKLDWYYTTATIKTSLHHPQQDRATQLFGAQVTPEQYREVLLNPRTHTGVRYHTHHKQRGGGNGGRGRGRGRGRRNSGRGRNNRSGRGEGGAANRTRNNSNP